MGAVVCGIFWWVSTGLPGWRELVLVGSGFDLLCQLMSGMKLRV